MADEPTTQSTTPQPLPQAAPTSTPAPGGMESQQLQELLGRLMKRAQQPPMAGPPPPPQAAQSLQQAPPIPHMLTRGVLGLAHDLATRNKKMQLDHATQRIVNIGRSISRAYEQAQGDPQKAQQLFEASPEYQSMLSKEGQKDAKQMEKLLQYDFLNPEKGKTVWHEALEKAAKIMGAEKAMDGIRTLMGKHKDKMAEDARKKQEEQKKQSEAKSVADTMFRAAGPEPTDPTSLLPTVLKAQELEESRKVRIQQLEMNAQQKRDELKLKRDTLDEKAQAGQETRDETVRHHKEIEGLTKELRDIQWFAAKEKGEAGQDARADWAELLRKGTSMSMIPAKERSGVVAYMKDQGWSVPRPLNAAEEKVLNDSLETSTKIDGWLAQLEQFRDPKTGELPNERFSFLSGRLAYWTGKQTPESALISDFSRERWQAVGGLLRGIRRGDIIKSMVQHTPDPSKDSIALMHTKLVELKKSFATGRAAVLRDRGYDLDPATGQPIESDKTVKPEDIGAKPENP